MADNHVLVLRSGPGTSQADRALGLAQALLAQNGSVVVALLQDAVLATLSAAAARIQGRFARRLRERPGVHLARTVRVDPVDEDRANARSRA
jgi:sulfur relay (sulfurtransferase) complex TusBCD TusD component (DsrE family)